MIYLNAMEYVKQNQNIIQMLFYFLRDYSHKKNNKTNIIVIRTTLHILQIFCMYSSNAFKIINKCAFSIAIKYNSENLQNNQQNRNSKDDHELNIYQIQNNKINASLQTLRKIKTNHFNEEIEKDKQSKLPYYEIIDCLSNGDLDIIENSLKLINTLIMKASTNYFKKILCDSFIAVGIIDKLLKIKDNVSSHNYNIKQLLFQFQSLIEDTLPISELDVWVLQSQIKKLNIKIKEKDLEIKNVLQKYAMIDIVNNEFIRYYNAINNAYKEGLLINTGLL